MLPLEIFYIYFSPDPKIIEEVRSAKSPVLAWETSSKYKHLQVPEFKSDEHKLEVMKRLMRLKAEQHKDVRDVLLASGEQRIVKHIVSGPPGDGFWDDGEDGTGLNHTGRMWMEIREELGNK